MHQIINAAYCIHYDDYDFLLDVVRSVREASTGVELAIYTDKPDFMAKQALLACAQLPAGEKLTARDIAAFQRACLAEGAETGVLCGAEGLTDSAKQQCTLYPSVHSLSRARMIALAGAAFPATDAQLVALGKRKRTPEHAKIVLRRMLEPHRARQYLLYGLMLCGLYIITGQRFYPLPGCACLLLMALCRALPSKEHEPLTL